MADIFNLTDTWDNGATLFNGIKLNVTNAASAAGSKLLDLQVGGTSKFSVDSNGRMGIGVAPNLSYSLDASGTLSAYQYRLSGSNGALYWNSDLALYRDATNTLGQRFGFNPQTYNIYNTYTHAFNYERAHIGFNDTADTFVIGTEAGSAGGTVRDIQLKIGANRVFGVDTTLFNTSAGAGALSDALLTGVRNTAMGYAALRDTTTGNHNSAIGYAALAANETGNYNSAIGYAALYNNVSGSYGVALGFNALLNSTASGNIGIGASSGSSLSSGAYNLAAGYQALLNADGNYNVVLGWQSARYQSGGTVNLTSAEDSIFIGKSTKGVEAATNQIVIGDSAEGLGSNTVVLGADSIVTTALKGNVGITSTWNDGATAFNGIKLDVTDTASAAGSKLLDLQVGGVSKFSVAADANIHITEGNFTGRTAITLPEFSNIETGNGRLWFQDGGGTIRQYFERGLELWQNGYLGICAGSPLVSAADVRLYRDAGNTFGQRNGINAQTYNLYNTYTSATDYERGFLKWNANVLEIGTEAGSGGGTARGLSLDAASIGLYGVTPVAQAAHIADATDATDVITRVNAILVALEAIGITAAA